MLGCADLEGEVRELLTEAKSWYRKKGGALPLQVRDTWRVPGSGESAHIPTAAHARTKY